VISFNATQNASVVNENEINVKASQLQV